MPVTLRREKHIAVHVVDEIAADAAIQLQGIAAAVKVQRHTVFVRPQCAVLNNIFLIIYKFPCRILIDAQPKIFVRVLPKSCIIAWTALVSRNCGQILPIDIALLRIPDPDQIRCIPVFVKKAHPYIALAVAVQIVKGDAVKCLLRIGDVHGKGDTVEQHLLRDVPVEGCAALAHCDQDIHTVAVMGDGSAADHHTGCAPIIPRHIIGIAAGGKAQAKHHHLRKECGVLPPVFHDTPPSGHSIR